MSADQVEALGRLTKLIEVWRATDPPPQRRYTMLAMVAGTLLIASVLFFDRMPGTEIELDIRASDVSFRLDEADVLLDGIRLAALGVSGLVQIEAPGFDLREGAVRIEAVPEGKRAGTITLAPLALPVGTRVRLRRNSVPREFRLSFQGGKSDFRCDVVDSVSIAAPGTPPRRLNLRSPRGIRCEGIG